MAYRVAYSTMNMKHIPNLLSLLRILLVGVVFILFLLPYEKPLDWIVFNVRLSPILLMLGSIFAVASFTDWLDGYLARRFKVESTLGKLIDPLADKLMVNVTALGLLVRYAWLPEMHHLMPLWVMTLWIIRDFTVDGLRLIAASKQVIIASHPIGKAKTVLQIISILLLTLNDLPFAWLSLPQGFAMTELFLYLTTLVSLLSGYYYVKSHFPLLKG
jgi:CDP-diacylglycerol---glycerol-3-phosphate 3-phosphatidyltransferase